MAEHSDVSIGAIREAMAYRVKYRLSESKSRSKRYLHLEMLCIHKDNRGGQYPMVQTAVNLGVGIFQDGFNPEDANHEGVCVQEIPEGSRPSGWETSYVRNRVRTAGTMLEGCFPVDAAVVAFGTLSHSHLLLTLLCWHYGLKWDVPTEGGFKNKWKAVLRIDGHLNADAVASVEPLLAETLVRGLNFEILTWKMQLEEPTAARKISQALNKGHARALETTELTAMAVLSGAAIAQAQGTANEVQYETVKEMLRGELDMYVDDPDFIELYDFVINLGAGRNTFISGFLEWASKFVDPKQRKLRLSAFAEANKIPVWAPRTKVAVIQRAYRKTPSRTICPNPEAAWGRAAGVEVELIEQVLCYYQAECKDIVGALGPVQSLAFLANVGIASTEAFIAPRVKNVTFKTALLEATMRYSEQLVQSIINSGWATLPKSTVSWIDYSTVVEKSSAKSPAKGKGQDESPAKACLPRIIVHSENAVDPFCSEQGRYEQEKPKVQWNALPWKAWLNSALAQQLDAENADMAAITQILRGLHVHEVLITSPLEVLQKEGSEKTLRVRVTKDVDAEEIWLPPCVPKSSKVYAQSTHPCRVPIVVRRPTTPVTVTTYYIVPEYKPPIDDTDASVEVINSGAKAWLFHGDETMHPFWAVPRVSLQQCEMQRSKATDGDEKISVNMELRTKKFQIVVVGNLQNKPMNSVFTVEVPFLVNERGLANGALLYWESATKPEATSKRPMNWRDAVVTNAKKAKAKACMTTPTKVKGVGGLMDADEI